jgi:hypothetical protein
VDAFEGSGRVDRIMTTAGRRIDMIISSASPYVDAIVTESHQAEALRKSKRLDNFIDVVEIHALRDFRRGRSA